MKNKEKYANKIVEIGIKGSRIAIINGKPAACDLIACEECDLNGFPCAELLGIWAESEHVEPKPKLTQQERAFCEAFVDEHYLYTLLYIARDEDESLYICNGKPKKEISEGEWDSVNFIKLKNSMFPFIIWDNEPWSIADLLKLEVENEKDN